jgi:hypothetical protein
VIPRVASAAWRLVSYERATRGRSIGSTGFRISSKRHPISRFQISLPDSHRSVATASLRSPATRVCSASGPADPVSRRFLLRASALLTDLPTLPVSALATVLLALVSAFAARLTHVPIALQSRLLSHTYLGDRPILRVSASGPPRPSLAWSVDPRCSLLLIYRLLVLSHLPLSFKRLFGTSSAARVGTDPILSRFLRRSLQSAFARGAHPGAVARGGPARHKTRLIDPPAPQSLLPER